MRASAEWYKVKRNYYLQVLGYLGECAPGRDLLDVGSGIGSFLALAQEQSWNVVGVEPSREAALYAQREYNVDVRPGLLQDLEFTTGTFDVVTLWCVIAHTRRPIELLRECSRVLKPGGMLFLHTPNIEFQLVYARLRRRLRIGTQEYFLQPRLHVCHFSATTLRRALQRAGFRSITLEAFGVTETVYALGGDCHLQGAGRVGVTLKRIYSRLAGMVLKCSFSRLILMNELQAVAYKR